ncbi:MAG: hypothetical protein ACM3JG_02705 [Thiohalocapsa sp.]
MAAWLLLLAASLLGAAATAQADGTVLRARDCGDKIFVSTGNDTYSVLTATGSNQGIADGDLLVGEVERIGFSLVYDRTAARSVSAIIEERRLDRAQINQRIAVRCRTSVSQAFIHGTVSRADGCSGRIIVNTDKGYAILQRLAGGMVADGDTLRGDFNQAGRATVKDDQTGATLTVFVEDFQLPKSAASRKIQTLCRR